MRHHLYRLTGSDPAPASGGDTRSWFYFYKWDVDGESFLLSTPETSSAEPGDWLWVVLDQQLVGVVQVTDVREDLQSGQQELYFSPQAAKVGTLDFSRCSDDTSALEAMGFWFPHLASREVS